MAATARTVAIRCRLLTLKGLPLAPDDFLTRRGTQHQTVFMGHHPLSLLMVVATVGAVNNNILLKIIPINTRPVEAIRPMDLMDRETSHQQGPMGNITSRRLMLLHPAPILNIPIRKDQPVAAIEAALEGATPSTKLEELGIVAVALMVQATTAASMEAASMEAAAMVVLLLLRITARQRHGNLRVTFRLGMQGQTTTPLGHPKICRSRMRFNPGTARRIHSHNKSSNKAKSHKWKDNHRRGHRTQRSSSSLKLPRRHRQQYQNPRFHLDSMLYHRRRPRSNNSSNARKLSTRKGTSLRMFRPDRRLRGHGRTEERGHRLMRLGSHRASSPNLGSGW